MLGWIVVAIAVALAIVVLTAVLAGRRRSASLRADFGPEYDRALEQAGDVREAEAALRRRRERRRGLDIRPLTPGARGRYAERWTATQRRFVDAPASAVTEADQLIAKVMRDRGYPVDDFEQRAADVSVDHPETVEHYREAHVVALASAHGRASTEDLRRAMVHFRALFDDLLHDGADGDAGRERHHVKEMG
jgi:hypothetical protein